MGNHPELIINADDFGWYDGQNLAVEKTYREGILNSASLMATGSAFEQAVRIAQANPGLRIGAHLVLNETMALSTHEDLPNLTTPGGRFHDSVRALVQLWGLGRVQVAEIEPEWRAQIEKILSAGIPIAHVDSHKHIHLLPPLLKTVVKLAKEYQIHYVRLPLERSGWRSFRRLPFLLPVWLLAWRGKQILDSEHLTYADNFIGFVDSGKMTLPRLQEALQRKKTGRSLEIMVHPAVQTQAIIQLIRSYPWAAGYFFEAELAALCSINIGSK